MFLLFPFSLFCLRTDLHVDLCLYLLRRKGLVEGSESRFLLFCLRVLEKNRLDIPNEILMFKVASSYFH